MAPRPQEGDETTHDETLVGLGLPLIHSWLLFSELTNSSYRIWLLFTSMASKALGVTHSRHMPPRAFDDMSFAQCIRLRLWSLISQASGICSLLNPPFPPTLHLQRAPKPRPTLWKDPGPIIPTLRRSHIHYISGRRRVSLELLSAQCYTVGQPTSAA